MAGAQLWIWYGLLLPSTAAPFDNDAAVQAGAARGAVAEQLPSELLQRMSARDSLIDTIILGFRSEVHLTPASTGCADIEVGWWCWKRDGDALEVLSGCEGQEPTIEHVVWNGSASYWMRTPGDWNVPLSLNPLHRVSPDALFINAMRTVGPLSKLSTPAYLGLFFARIPWSQFLPKASDILLRPDETVVDRPCFTFVADLDMKASDGTYTNPWKISIDDRHSLLVTRMQSYTDGAELSVQERRDQSSAGRVLDLGGKTYYRHTFVELESIVEISSGIWIGAKALSGTDRGNGVYTETDLDISTTSVNAPGQEGHFTVDVPEDTLVDDARTGERYYSGHKSDANYSCNRVLYSQVRELDPDMAEKWRARSHLQEPLANADTRELSLYFFRWMLGDCTSFRSVHDAVPGMSGSMTPTEALWRAWSSLTSAGVKVTDCELRPNGVPSMPQGTWLLLTTVSRTGRDFSVDLVRRLDANRVVSYRPGQFVKQYSWDQWVDLHASTTHAIMAVADGTRVRPPPRPNGGATRTIAAVFAALATAGILLLRRSSGTRRPQAAAPAASGGPTQ